VLLIEDDQSTAVIFSRLLSSIGATVKIAPTVAAGLEALKQPPHLLVLDMLLPDGTGLQILETLHPRSAALKVAVVSGNLDPQTLQALNAFHPDATFSKPLDFEKFVDWLTSILTDLPVSCYRLK
jgi:CheY-like chemotaxis protein